MSPIGFYGTPIHVMTNKKVDSKISTIKDIAVRDAKITGKTAAVVGTAGAAAAVATVASKSVSNALTNAKSKVGQALSEVAVGGESNLKEVIKNSDIYTKLNALPKPVKAAIAAGVAALSIIAPYVGYHTMTKNAAIEGNHETK